MLDFLSRICAHFTSLRFAIILPICYDFDLHASQKLGKYALCTQDHLFNTYQKSSLPAAIPLEYNLILPHRMSDCHLSPHTVY